MFLIDVGVMMYNTIATIPMDDPARISLKLTNHWRHKFEIDKQDNVSVVHFADDLRVKLIAEETALIAHIEMADATQAQEYEDVVVRHINRMAQTEYDVTWQRDA